MEANNSGLNSTYLLISEARGERETRKRQRARIIQAKSITKEVSMYHLLLIAEADRVLCHRIMFQRLFALDLQNEIQLLSRFFCYSWLACLLGFCLRNAPLAKK